jgi:hypothetical protein
VITHDEIIELGKKYGFSTAVLGYSDVEAQLIIFATQVYVRGFNEGVRQERELDFLDVFADETGLAC